MRIWLINVGEELPTDAGTPRLLRTGILAEHLVAKGHDVVWWNATFNHQRKEQRASATVQRATPQGYSSVLLYGRSYQRNISGSRIASQLQNALEFHRLAPTLPRPDAILCGYPTIELAALAVRFAKVACIPIAVDFRDMWPDVIAEQTTGTARLAAAPFLAVWNQTLHYIVRNATAIVGVTDGFVDWALDKVGRQRSPIDRSFHLAVNPQKPLQSDVARADAMWTKMGVGTDPTKLYTCFIGTLSRRLDIPTLVAGALSASAEVKQRLQLVVCGKGDLDGDLRNMVGDDDTVIFPGWRNAAEISALLSRCHIGTLPYLSTADFVRHYPNKVGEYLGAGLPIMTPLEGQVRTLLSKHNLGYFYQEANPESASRCLSDLVARCDELRAKRNAALAVYDELFDSTQIYADFVRYLEELPGAAAQKAIE